VIGVTSRHATTWWASSWGRHLRVSLFCIFLEGHGAGFIRAHRHLGADLVAQTGAQTGAGVFFVRLVAVLFVIGLYYGFSLQWIDVSQRTRGAK
jgi:hypothetical protein